MRGGGNRDEYRLQQRIDMVATTRKVDKVTVGCIIGGMTATMLGAILCWAGCSTYEQNSPDTTSDVAAYYALFIWCPVQNVLFGIVALILVVLRPVGYLSLEMAGNLVWPFFFMVRPTCASVMIVFLCRCDLRRCLGRCVRRKYAVASLITCGT